MTASRQIYADSMKDLPGFWEKKALQFQWYSPWKRVKNTDFTGEVTIRWFEGATLNITENCLDRHLPENAQKTAILWEADAPDAKARSLTFQELHDEVCRFANGLKSL